MLTSLSPPRTFKLGLGSNNMFQRQLEFLGEAAMGNKDDAYHRVPVCSGQKHTRENVYPSLQLESMLQGKSAPSVELRINFANVAGIDHVLPVAPSPEPACRTM